MTEKIFLKKKEGENLKNKNPNEPPVVKVPKND